mgnify:CR=1 FL=1
MKKNEFTVNICPFWIDIIDVMLEAWKEHDLSSEARSTLRKEFRKLAKCGDQLMKDNNVGPYEEV